MFVTVGGWMVQPTVKFWRRPTTSRANLAQWLLSLVVAKISRWAELSPKRFSSQSAAQSTGINNTFFQLGVSYNVSR